jgi:hypothetical protein
MQSAAAEILPGRRRKTQLVTLDSLDGRTHAARQVNAILRSLQRQLGRKATSIELNAMRRVATLQAIAEDARVRLLRGDKRISIDQVVRSDGAARRAMKDLRAVMRAPKADFGATPGMVALFDGAGEVTDG